MNKRNCVGCYDDVYNHGLGGAKECWGLESAKLIKRKEVSIYQKPPFTQKSKLFPDCYSRQIYSYIND